ncbi:MAG TPA: biotin/lipoate--protein ligase family protein [Beijerinckiaceae bacterium]|nr:biotin/lipoate--protein ligase family protein [Beijerinckiaceae bacterium]
MGRKVAADVWDERFPPLFEPVRLREHEDAFSVAMARAAESGAGTVFHVGRFDPIEFAVVLEPDMPLAAARRALFVGMNALAATILADCPPERVVEFSYPDGLVFDNGLIGGARIAFQDGRGDRAAVKVNEAGRKGSTRTRFPIGWCFRR